MNKFYRTFPLIFLLLTGCVTLYKPNVIHSPMIKEKGEFSSTAALGLSGSGIFNLQAAYGISDHWALMADGMYHYKKSLFEDDISGKRTLRMRFAEGGIGYFKVTGAKKNSLFQCYGGAGSGHSFNIISNLDGADPEVVARYNNVFVQPGIVLLNKKYMISFDLRANYVMVNNINAYKYEEFDMWSTNFRYYENLSLDFVLMEPTITFKGLGNKLKFVAQVGATLPVIHTTSYFDVNTVSVLLFPLIKFNVGINYTIGKKHSNKVREIESLGFEKL